MYEDGRIDTNDIHATGGTFENVTVQGIFKNPFNAVGNFVSDSDNYVSFNSTSIRAIRLPIDIGQSGRKVTFVGYFIITSDKEIFFKGNSITSLYEISNEITELVAVRVSETEVRWHVLRRIPYGSYSKTINSNSTLEGYGSTVIVNNSSAITITLPANPHEGQTYRLLHTTDAAVTLNWNNKPAINVATGSTPNATFSARRTVVLTFCNNTWYAEYINLAS